MNIVIEGFDASGKSTLAHELQRELGRPIFHSTGPTTLEELNKRAKHFLDQRNVVFDRHPCVGEPIYYILRGGSPLIDPKYVEKFYKQKSLIIYCRGDRGPHIAREEESAQHVKDVETHRIQIQTRYDDWAKEHASIWYRVGDNVRRLVAMVQGAIASES